jgi:hypothetical protein
MSEFKDKIRRRFTKKKVGYSFLLTLFLTCACYIHNNMAGLTNEDTFRYLMIQKASEMGFEKKVSYGDAVYVNVYYDRELIPVYRQDTQEPKGTTVVTNRQKLYRFLHMLHKSNRAKFIILDLGFDPNEVTAYDDSLYNEIRDIDNIVFAHDNNSELPRPWLKDKSALAVYRYTLANTGFSRYEYTSQDGERYIPTKVYEYFHPSKKIRRSGYGWFSIYFSGDSKFSLCQNASFLIFDKTTLSEYSDTENVNESYAAGTTFYNLGEDFITPIEDSIYTEKEMCEQIERLTDGKYVVIGNLVQNDNHDTYFGEKPGSLLLMRALQTLEERGNTISAWQIIGWPLIFFLISICINDEPLLPFNKRLRFNAKCRVGRFFLELLYFALGFVSITLFLNCCNAIGYICFDKVTSLLIPKLAFSIEKLYYQYITYKTDEN